MHPHLKEVLFTREQIAERVKELAEVVSRDYEGKKSTCCWNIKRVNHVYG